MTGRPSERRPVVDVVDETFLVAAPDVVRAVLCDPLTWSAWFPDLVLSVVQDRGPLGVRWRVGGSMAGSAEVWVERWHDGVVAHVFLQAEPPDEVAPRRGRRLHDHHARLVRRELLRLKDLLERGRATGTTRDGWTPPGPADARPTPGPTAGSRVAASGRRSAAPAPRSKEDVDG